MKKIFLAILFSALIFSCAMNPAPTKKTSLKIVNWNVQTFFDGNNDGIEYSNFIKSKKWGTEAYKARLKKLCSAINALDGDLVILEEIENEGIVYDISNFLAGNSWNPRKVYHYACFAKKKNSSIGCAVLSRAELSGMKVHSLDIKSEASGAPSMRPIIEVDLLSGNKGNKKLKIFVNHWKSKADGEAESEIWRRWQEGLLADKISYAQKENPDAAIICAGDFNQDISEFCAAHTECNLDGAMQEEESPANILLRAPYSTLNAPVYSPWPDYEGGGSYNFRDKWERIDHFFSCGKIRVTDFSPATGEWSYDDGRPKPFKIYSLSGWSDHLPIVCRAEF